MSCGHVNKYRGLHRVVIIIVMWLTDRKEQRRVGSTAHSINRDVSQKAITGMTVESGESVG